MIERSAKSEKQICTHIRTLLSTFKHIFFLKTVLSIAIEYNIFDDDTCSGASMDLLMLSDLI